MYFAITDAFRHRVEQYLESSESNIIFKHDLHTMAHLAENEEDLKTLHKMIVR